MNFTYLPRLLCISLASFFLLHAAVGALIAVLSPWLIRWAERLQPRMAAGLLLTARLMPAAVAIFVVAALCIPSYLWLEKETGTEKIGFFCLFAAALAIAITTKAAARSLRAVVRSMLYVKRINMAARRSRGAWIVDSQHAFISLAGVLDPQVFVSRAIVQVLSREQLAAALRHERAHRDSRDNLKRLLLAAAPGLLPFLHGFKNLENAWNRFSEWAADDRAAGNARRTLALASALVRVARMTPAGEPQPLITSLASPGENFSARVDRLLRETPEPELPIRFSATHLALMLSSGFTLFAAMLLHGAMSTIHSLLEYLIR
jgi:Zn-dependent protease with chaperone function